MENQSQNTPETPENGGDNGGKKQSKHFLVVYIIGLFSVALVLILLSYLTQVRAKQQLVTMQNQVSEQTTVAQGAQQQMASLQETVQQQQKKLDEQEAALQIIREKTDTQQGEKVVDAITLLEERYIALDALQQVRRLIATGDTVTSQELLSKMLTQYGRERLLPPETENAVLLGQNAVEFHDYCAQLGLLNP